MRFETRPLPPVWPTGQRTPPDDRQYSRFKATWNATMNLLQHELRWLEAVEPVIIEAGYRSHEIRLDGQPRAGARPEDPGVVVSFDSRLGPLRYVCDAYREHAANLRAIALTLEHLRAVDRYGVTKRGEQYQGWAALPPSDEGEMNREEAEAFIRRQGAPNARTDGIPLERLYRLAARRLHPDAGGNPVEWAKLDRARRVVGL